MSATLFRPGGEIRRCKPRAVLLNSQLRHALRHSIQDKKVCTCTPSSLRSRQRNTSLAHQCTFTDIVNRRSVCITDGVSLLVVRSMSHTLFE